MIIAVDFDGTLFENDWPNIGEPKWNVINWCKNQKELGHTLVLWTCRGDDDLDKAIEACKNVGIIFDAINSNMADKIEHFNGHDSRKIGADIYLDDKAVRPEEL